MTSSYLVLDGSQMGEGTNSIEIEQDGRISAPSTFIVIGGNCVLALISCLCTTHLVAAV